MIFYRYVIGAGLAVAVLGLLVLIFQATMFLVFDYWYAFSLLQILQRFHLREYLTTDLQSLNDTIDFLLAVPLAGLLIVFGALVGVFGLHSLREESKWSSPE